MSRLKVGAILILIAAAAVGVYAQSTATGGGRTTTTEVTITVTNVQGAQVSVDNAKPVPAPVVVQLKAGNYAVSISAAGFVTLNTTIAVAATADKKQAFAFQLQPMQVQVSFASNVQGADIAVNTPGQPTKGKIPFAAQLIPGSYDVTVSAAGYKPYAGKIAVGAGAGQTFTFQLEAATVKVQFTTNVPASIAVTGGANVNLQAKSPATVDLMPAQYNITLNAQGYQQFAGTMVVDPKGVDPKTGMQVFNFVLQPAMSTLVLPAQYLEGDVQFVKVYLDGKLMNAQIAVKGSIQVPPGKHKVRLASAPVGLATEAEFEFAPGQTYEMRLQLQFVVPQK
jgi:hypothetical protein